jgi:hypothetical protein
MTNKDENNKNHTIGQQSEEKVEGRTHNSQNPAIEQADSHEDISAVDQQEGNMSHGETGGSGFAAKEE